MKKHCIISKKEGCCLAIKTNGCLIDAMKLFATKVKKIFCSNFVNGA